MAHEIVFDDLRGINPICFVGETPWHGLGQQLAPDSPIEVWCKQSGMDFSIMDSPVSFTAKVPGMARTNFNYPNRKALYRDDTGVPLSIVGKDYKVVQPGQVLEFFRDITEAGGFKLNTAGVLFGGSRYWALAEIGQSARIMGQDDVKGFLLLATACDGSLATTASFTSIRVVCNNTLNFAVDEGEAGRSRKYLKIPHSRTFNPDEVKAELGLASASFETFIDSANRLATRRVKDAEALEWLIRVFGNVKDDQEIGQDELNLVPARNVKACLELFKGNGKGSNLRSADGTAWGLVNAVTEFTDHHRATRTQDARLDSAWFGDSASIKDRAWAAALKLAA